jgi:hypothetical protein
VRAGELIGRTAHDRSGRRLGRVVDVVVVADADGRFRLCELVVARRWYGRLVGSEPYPAPGPWPIPALARLLRLSTRHVALDQVHLLPPVPGLVAPTGGPG